MKSTNWIESDEVCQWVCCKEYTNRWGQRMIASNYGYKYWRFFIKSKKH